MKKCKTSTFVLIAVVLFLLADILYWTTGFPLDTRLPAKQRGEAELWYYDESFTMEQVAVDETDFGRLAVVLDTMPVTNRPRFSTISRPHFFLVLYDSGGNPITMTVVENGDITAELPNGSRRCFDSGYMLYNTLLEMKKN